jgi:hypothetical protein
MFSHKQLNEKEISTVINDIVLIYLFEKVSNIRYDDLICKVSKKIILDDKILGEILDRLIELST